jgi:hypothetical protein
MDVVNATVTFDEIWMALREDPEFGIIPEPVQEAMKPFVQQFPVLFKDLLAKPVSVETVFEAKRRFFNFAIESGYVKATLDATPDEAFGFFDRETVLEMSMGMLEQMLPMLNKILKNVSAFLKENRIDETSYLLHPKTFGFKPEVARGIKAGTLCIADLLRMQPYALLKNDNK